MTTNGDMTLRDEVVALVATLRELGRLEHQGAAFMAVANEGDAILARHPAPDPVADAVRDRANYRHTNGEAHP